MRCRKEKNLWDRELVSQKHSFKKEGLIISVCYYVEVKENDNRKKLAFILAIRSLVPLRM